MYRIGVDIGGTFTDFALFDARGAKMSVHKRLTTPHDPSVGVMQGILAICATNGVPVADIAYVMHGTTTATNAVLERKLARGGHWAGWNNSTTLPEGSCSRTCLPPGPSRMSLRNGAPAARRRATSASMSSTMR